MVRPNIVQSLRWDPGHHEELRNGSEGKNHISQCAFRVHENFRNFRVFYRNGSSRFWGSHWWGSHIQREEMGLEGAYPELHGPGCHNPLRPSRPSKGKTLRGYVGCLGGKALPLAIAPPTLGGSGGKASRST
jgi:hypothetical protein